MSVTTMVHVRVDEKLKKKASKALEAMGLSISDIVRMLLKRVAVEQAVPFNVRVPKAETIATIQELEAGKGKKFKSVEDLMADLNAHD